MPSHPSPPELFLIYPLKSVNPGTEPQTPPAVALGLPPSGLFLNLIAQLG